MSLQIKRRSSVNTEKESEDLFATPKKVKRSRNKASEKDNDVLHDDSLFGELVSKAGYILKKGDKPNLLNCDQAMFQRDLRWSLRSHSLYQMPEIAEKFVKGLEDHIEDSVRLKWALLYTQTVKDCVTARGGHQDSLIRLCLNIEELQPFLIKLLTEKLLEIANDDESSSQANIPNLVLANLKWLDRIVDSDTLTAKIVDILEGSPLKVQQEVINFVPNIVEDANHPRIAEVLCELYDTVPELTSAILDTLGHLTLAPDCLEDVRHSVLKTLQATRPEQLPIVTRFLLNNTPQPIAYQVLNDMREKINLPDDHSRSKKSPRKTPRKHNLSSTATNNNCNEEIAYKVLLINNIKMATLTHKYLSTAWLKVINDDAASVGSLDVLILLILYDSVPSQRRHIESIFRNKIRTCLFSDTMLEKTFTNHSSILKEHFEPLKKMAILLFRCPEPLVSQAGATLYRLSFIHLDGYQKQEIVLALLKHLGDNSSVRLAALSLLSSLAHESTASMSKFTIFLKGSLDMVDELGLGEVKRLLDVVSLLAYSDSSHAALQDELVILVRKQLSHTDLKYKLIGVLNAALVVKNMVAIDDSHNSVSTSTTSTSASGLNSSFLKEAENLLHLVLSSTARSPTASALFMDEMASITLKEGMNSKLEEWVCEKMTDDFQETFVLDHVADSQPPETLFPLAVCWNLDEGVEDGGIILNLAPMVIKAEPTRNDPVAKESKLVSLAPQFRLLRMLESRLHDGELSNIDALLGCPVYGPAPLVLEKFESHSRAEQHAVLSCLFYTINWFLELINAFVTQKDIDLKQKVFSRVQQVIELQTMLSQFLPKCPSYSPPLAVFDLDTSAALPTFTIANTKKGKKGRKAAPGKGKKKNKGKESNTEVTQLGTQPTSQPTTQPTPQPTLVQPQEKDSDTLEVPSTVDMISLRPFFRELHLDVFCLLFRKLSLDTEMHTQSQLSLSEAEFLLTDLNFKLMHVFGAGHKRASVLGHGPDKSIGYSHLDLFTPGEVAQRALRFLKPVCVHLETISGFFQSMIADNDGVMDAPGMFSERTRPLMKVNSMLFTTLHVFLSWTGLRQEDNKIILTAILRTIAKKLEGEVVSGMGQEELISTVFRYISNFHASVVSIGTASILVQTLVVLTLLPEHEDFSEKLVEVIEELLKREWYGSDGEREKGSVFNQHVHTLLQEYFQQSKTPLVLIENICTGPLEEFMKATGRDPYSEALPTLNKGTLGTYYRSMISFLVSGTKKSLSAISSTSNDNMQRLLVWDTAIKIFHTLIMILKKNNSRHLLSSCLKYARSFLELFLRSAMPLMDKSLRLHNQEVVTLMKSLQGSTRVLQHVCTHSKVNQDTTLTRYVPLVKKSLEMLVYRVKAMLALNKCCNAFWMGNLKNRDLHGKEILSQSDRVEAETSEGEQDEGGNDEEEEEEEEVNDDQSDVDLDEEEEEKSKSGKDDDEDRATDYSTSF
ncbi:Fanconi anemia group D2 protein isoform X2 [Procambarus clarkii]|uniref:Fanconi anemia group D2 protein isoform X2 n=1 Tax=Procambarus clarkii TaxID=6728 RepID=UPI0037423248